MMSEQKERDIEYFEQLSDDPLPELISQLKAKDTAQVRQLIDSVLQKERDGLDSLFESMSQTLKFIPNFFLHTLTARYISPAVAARITVKLTFKQVVSIASGLPPEHIGETIVYMEKNYAAQILGALPKKRATRLIDYLMKERPLHLLDMLQHVDTNILDLFYPTENFLSQDTKGMNKLRAQMLEKIKDL